MILTIVLTITVVGQSLMLCDCLHYKLRRLRISHALSLQREICKGFDGHIAASRGIANAVEHKLIQDWSCRYLLGTTGFTKKVCRLQLMMCWSLLWLWIKTSQRSLRMVPFRRGFRLKKTLGRRSTTLIWDVVWDKFLSSQSPSSLIRTRIQTNVYLFRKFSDLQFAVLFPPPF